MCSAMRSEVYLIPAQYWRRPVENRLLQLTRQILTTSVVSPENKHFTIKHKHDI